VAVHEHGVGLSVVIQEGRRLLGHLLDVAHEHDARLRGDEVRDQEVEVPEPQREREPAKEAAMATPPGPE